MHETQHFTSEDPEAGEEPDHEDEPRCFIWVLLRTLSFQVLVTKTMIDIELAGDAGASGLAWGRSIQNIPCMHLYNFAFICYTIPHKGIFILTAPIYTYVCMYAYIYIYIQACAQPL